MRVAVMLVCVALPLASASAEERVGTIQLCRPARMAGGASAITVPPGTEFTDSGSSSRPGATNVDLPVTLRTIDAVTLGRGRRCVGVAAKAAVGRASLVVSPGNHRTYSYSGSAPGGDDPGLAGISARPTTRFK